MIPAVLFTPPVGTPAERARAGAPGEWYVSNAYGNYYQLVPGVWAYHTGADLIKPGGAHLPVYAIANGLVTFARRVPNSTWGNVIVIGHTLPDGTEIYSRYGHVENPRVVAGEMVVVGQQIAQVGDADGQFAYHLHFDISPTRRLLTNPADWPGLDMARLRADYIDPIAFLREKRANMSVGTQIKTLAEQISALADTLDQAPPPPPPADAKTATVTADRLNVRSTPSTSGSIVAQLTRGTSISVIDLGNGWAQIAAGDYNSRYVSSAYLSFP